MELKDVKYIVVHCSATRLNMDVNTERIRQWHTAPKPKGNGWSAIGYHFVIERDGKIEEGREITRPGAHVRGYNKQSIGVCLVGGLNKNSKGEFNFTREQMDSLEKLLSMLSDMAPNATIQGHRDFPGVNKACPCFDVKAWWSENSKG